MATPPAAARAWAWLGGVGFAVLAYVPVLLTDRGRVAADTKTYLYLDPGRFLAGSSSMWDPKIGLGTVSHQTIGYLFPMGPFYWVLEQALGVPAWVSQRLWLGTLVFAAGLGMWYLLRTLGVRGPGIAVAVLAFAFTPYVLEFSARLSVLLGPWAALPWMVAFVVRALRRGGWVYPALFALTVQLVGGVNASALLFVGIGPVLWIPYAVLVLREVSWRRAWTVVWRTGLLTLLASVWWMSGLWTQSRYGLDVLRFTESLDTVSHTALASEVLRGLGYWFFYGRDRSGLWNGAALELTQVPWLIFLSFLLPALAMLSAAVLRWRDRAYFVLVALAGVVIAVAASPYENPSTVGSAFKSFATSSTTGFALRSTARAVPLLAMGFAALLGAGVSALADRMRNTRVSWAGTAVAVLVGGLCLANAPGIWNGRYYSTSLEHDEQVPAYWRDALAYLDARPHATRVLALPGSDFAAYRWGNTVDPIEPGLMDRPYVARELVPWGSEPAANLLQAIDRRFQEGPFEHAALAPIARLMGVGDVLVRMDLQSERFNLLPASTLWRLFGSGGQFGLGAPKAFGVAPSAPDGGPPVAVLPVEDPLAIVRTKADGAPLVVDGDGEGLVNLAGAGLLDARRLVLYSPAYERDPVALRDRLSPGAVLIVTDSNRKRAQRWSSLRDNFGYTEQAGERAMREDPLDQRLTVFPGSTDASRTVTVLRGVKSVRATTYGSGTFGYSTSERPSRALDGDLRSAWQVGGGRPAVGRERLRIELERPITTDHVNLVQAYRGTHARWISQVTLRFDRGKDVHATLGRASRRESGQVVRFPSRSISTIEIRIDRVRAGPAARHLDPGQSPNTPVGLAEVRLVDDRQGATPVRVEEVTQMPRDLLASIGARSRDHALGFVMTRDDAALVRRLVVPTPRVFAVAGTVTLNTGATDDALDARVGLPGAADGGVTATSSTRLFGFPQTRASSALDGDPTTGWAAPYSSADNPWVRVQMSRPMSLDHLDLQLYADGLHSVPTSLEVRSEDGTTRQVHLPLTADQSVPAATVAVPIRFPALHGRVLTVTVRTIREVDLPNPRRNTVVQAPVGIAELGVSGVRVARVPAAMPTACIADLLEVDGRPFPIRVLGTTADAFAREALPFEPCDTTARVSLAPGPHELHTRMGRESGLNFDRVVLSSAPAGATAPASVPAAPRMHVVRQDRTSMTVRVDRASAPFWLVLGQSLNRGWVAKADGHDLGAPELVDGYANGWRVVPGRSGAPMTITLEWVPQRVVRAAIVGSAAAVLLCLGILAVAFARRRRRRTGAPEPPSTVHQGSAPRLASPWRAGGGTARPSAVATTVLATGIGAALLVRLWVGLLVAALVLLVLLRPRWRAVLSLAPAVMLVVIGLSAALGQSVRGHAANFDWPVSFAGARTPAWIAIVLLAADAVVGIVRRAEAGEADAGPERGGVSAGSPP